MADLKYKTVAELKQAYVTGEITEPLYLDNDHTSVYHDGEPVFGMHPGDVLEQALRLLEIPSAYV
jgi:hypothetical protein